MAVDYGRLPAGWRTYGVDIGNGMVEVWATDDQGNFMSLGTETTQENQGGGAGQSGTGGDLGSILGSIIGGLGGSGVMNIEPTAELDRELEMLKLKLQQDYLNLRLNMLEIPEMLLADERQRHELALNSAMFQAEQTGWLNPNDFNTKRMIASTITQQLLPLIGTQYGKTFYKNAADGTIKTIDEMRNEIMAAAGGDSEYWAGASDQQIVDEYNKLSGTQYGSYNPFADLAEQYNADAAATEGPVAAGTDLNMVYQPGVGFVPQSGYEQGGWTPTMAGAQQLASPRGIAENLAMLGGTGQPPTYSVNPVGLPLQTSPYIQDKASRPTYSVNPVGLPLQNSPYKEDKPSKGMVPGTDPRVLPREPSLWGTTGSTQYGTGPMQGSPMLGVNVPGGEAPTAMPMDQSQWMANILARIQERMAQMGNPNIDMQELLKDPSQLPTALLSLGFTPQEVGQMLQDSPLVQQYTQQAGGASTGTPNFSFITGRQLPVREMLQAVKTNNPLAKMVSGLASFSGQDTGQFWGDFEAALPQGGRNPLTRFI